MIATAITGRVDDARQGLAGGRRGAGHNTRIGGAESDGVENQSVAGTRRMRRLS